MAGIPMVAVATNLAHDGIASPVSSLEHESGKGSFGVAMPVAVVVDLGRVRSGPPRMVRSGIGDVLSNLSAAADWELAERYAGERIDGLALMLARNAAEAVLHQPGAIESDAAITVLAEALVLSGIAMSVAGSSRPCSGGEHEILHAVDEFFPGTANHGELAGMATLFCMFLRGEKHRWEPVSACLARHGLPRTPGDLGLSGAEFAKAVAHAPATRPGRYTILEHLGLGADAAGERVEDYVRAVTG
jgi:glycerol-1-phosphate dehydrogenase [NAD(P)+]